MLNIMNRALRCLLFTGLLIGGTSLAQELKVAPLDVNSSHSEIAPHVHDSILYFVSNRKSAVLVNVFNQNEEHLYKLYKATLTKDGKIGRVSAFDPDPGRNLSHGPVTFSPDGRFLIATLNKTISLREAQKAGGVNQLTMFKVPFPVSGNETVTELPLSIDGYSVGQPSLSPDGGRLFFVSNSPDGFGETDIYLSYRTTDSWSAPENLGNVINTSGRELFPFFHESGKLYFSSDGHGGYGGLDIFYSVYDGDWSVPVALQPPINSPFDDFSCYIFPDETSGFIASSRDGADNLYSFWYELTYCENPLEVVEDHFCYTFFEESALEVDTLPHKYRWTFSDGHSAIGAEVDHCFPGPGFYEVSLNVIDSISGEELYAVARYDLELEKTRQVYFQSPDKVRIGEQVVLSAVLNGFGESPENVKYFWDIGDGERRLGETISHIFRKRGIYRISCEAYYADEIICSYRTIVVE
jgi:hypothetical protein